MKLEPAEGPQTLDSLSTRQIGVLLRALDQHRDWLEATHQDAKRYIRHGKHPAYLVDYELLRRYMYDAAKYPEQVLELALLFDQKETVFLLGIGTEIEIRAGLQQLSFFDTTIHHRDPIGEQFFGSGSGSGTQLKSQFMETLERVTHIDEVALARLQRVLSQDNFLHVGELGVKTDSSIHDEVFEIVRSTLDTIRPGYSRNNMADAINFSHVVTLRHSDWDHFPFLLTNTRSLLDERILAADPVIEATGGRSAVSRNPATAIYSRIAMTVKESAEDTAAYTTKLAFRAAQLEYQLRMSPGYTGHVPHVADSAWELLVAERRIGDSLKQYVDLMAAFVTDEIIAETQRIFDNTQASAANMLSQRGHVYQLSSPRRLFDLIVGISKALETKNTAENFAQAWRYAIDRTQSDLDADTRVIRFSEKGSRNRSPFLEIENHRSGEYFVCRWPTDSELESILSSFCGALSRHGKNVVCLQAGTENMSVLEFDAELPITLGELNAEMNVLREELDDPDSPLGAVTWLRLNADSFDLYADVLTAPERDPVVGVIVKKPDWDHMADLCYATSSRFLFHSWLSQVFHSAIAD